MHKSGSIDVAFICDEAFALPTGVAIASLLASRNSRSRCSIHVVSSGLSADSVARLKSLADKRAEISIHEVDGAEFAAITSSNVHVSSTAVFKFRLPELFPDLDRILYLDGDIVVRGDLSGLWRTKMKNAYVAVVEDTQARRFGGKTLKERIGYPFERYFNSGVMLVNLAAWRQDGITEKLLDYRLHGKNDFMDQDALNSVLGGRAVFLDMCYNTLATSLRYEEEPTRKQKESEAVIYHYASSEKPWKLSDVDNAELWNRAFADSPFADVKLELGVRSELDTFKRRSHMLWIQLERARRESEVLQEKLELGEAEVRELQGKLTEQMKSVAGLQDRQAKLEAEKAGVETKLGESEAKLAAVETKLGEATARSTALDERLAASEKTAEERLKSIAWLKNQHVKLEAEKAGVEAKLGGVETKLSEVETKLSETEMKLGETTVLAAELDERLAASAQLATERLTNINCLKQSLEGLIMERDALQKRIDENILISVLIPVYNAEKYLRETLASVMDQGLTNIEIIAVDNCSTDGSLAILREIEPKEPRLRVIALPENGGVRASRGAALEAARGRYICFLDADDLLEPDILAQAFAAAEAGHCDVLQFGHREFRDGETEFFRTSLPDPKCVGADIKANPDILYLQSKYIWDKLFRHQMLIDNDIRIPVYNYMEDHYFLYSVAMKAKNFGILSVYGYRYRRMVATARTRSYTDELLDCSKAYWDIVRTTRKAGLFKELAGPIWRNAAECYRWRVLGFASYDNTELQGRIVKDWFDFFQANYPRWQRNLHMMGIPCVLPPGQPKKVLLLGGTGALGAHLRDILAERGFEVWVTSRSAHADTEHIHYLQLDAMDYNAFKKLTASRWDAIVDFMIYPPKTFEARLPVFLKKTDQYVSLSSSRVYADAGESPITEESPRLLDTVKDEVYLKTNEYALAKARDENLLREIGIGKNWTIIRPYVTFSEERLQLGTLEKENWLRRALDGKPIVFSKDVAEKTTTLTYGRDVALGMAALIGRKEALGETFHITVSRSLRWSEVLAVYVRVLTEVLGKSPEVVMTKTSLQLETPGKYQVMYDRTFNRHFDSSKIARFVDVSKFRDPEEALESCLRAFLASKREFRQGNVQLEALHDLACSGWISRLTGRVVQCFQKKGSK